LKNQTKTPNPGSSPGPVQGTAELRGGENYRLLADDIHVTFLALVDTGINILVGPII
jgi:hypothetical protein